MGRRGFTLVETLVAMVVLGVGLLAIAKMSMYYIRSNVAAHTISEAAVLAQEKMEQLRSYATSERADNFSVFDFNYLTSTDPCFTTVADPPVGYAGSTVKNVPGLLSGGVAGTGTCTGVTGAPLATTMGTTYEVMYDTGAALVTNPNYGDDTAGDGVWTGADRIYLDTVSTTAGTGFFVTRRWMVEPMVAANGRTSFARLAVESYWTDQFGAEHDIRIESLVHMRQ